MIELIQPIKKDHNHKVTEIEMFRKMHFSDLDDWLKVAIISAWVAAALMGLGFLASLIKTLFLGG